MHSEGIPTRNGANRIVGPQQVFVSQLARCHVEPRPAVWSVEMGTRIPGVQRHRWVLALDLPVPVQGDDRFGAQSPRYSRHVVLNLVLKIQSASDERFRDVGDGTIWLVRDHMVISKI